MFYWETPVISTNQTKIRKHKKQNLNKKNKKKKNKRKGRKLKFNKQDNSTSLIKNISKYHKEKKYIKKKYRKLKKLQQNDRFNLMDNQLNLELNSIREEERKYTNDRIKKRRCDCEHICDILTGNCQCYDGFELQKDGKTCKGKENDLVHFVLGLLRLQLNGLKYIFGNYGVYSVLFNST